MNEVAFVPFYAEIHAIATHNRLGMIPGLKCNYGGYRLFLAIVYCVMGCGSGSWCVERY